MAKSIRSKWRRKMRAIKRVRYGEKELAKLKMILETAQNASTTPVSNDVEMSYDESIVKVLPPRLARRISRGKKYASRNPSPKPKPTDESMETDKAPGPQQSSKFPIWMGSHRRKKLIVKNKILKKKKEKEMKKALKKRR